MAVESSHKYFLADPGDLPAVLQTPTRLLHTQQTVKFSVCGVTQSDWDNYVAGKGYTEITYDEARCGRYWGKVQDTASVYSTDENGYTSKVKEPITDPDKALCIGLMKKVAKDCVQFGIDKGAGAPYNTALLTVVDNCTTMQDINLFFENYLGLEQGLYSAQSLGMTESDGITRTYESRTFPTFITGVYSS